MTTEPKQPDEQAIITEHVADARRAIEEEAEPSMADLMLEVLRRRQAKRAAEIPLFVER